MALEIKVPTLGESVTEATVGQWLKKQGDAVARDEPLVELETDKVTIEVPAPAAGRLEKIAVKDGETVARRRAARHAGGRRGRQGRADQGRAGNAAAASRAGEGRGRRRGAAPPRRRDADDEEEHATRAGRRHAARALGAQAHGGEGRSRPTTSTAAASAARS